MGSTDSIQQIRKINDRLDPTDQKDNVRLRVALILSERDTKFVISISI